MKKKKLWRGVNTCRRALLALALAACVSVGGIPPAGVDFVSAEPSVTGGNITEFEPAYEAGSTKSYYYQAYVARGTGLEATKTQLLRSFPFFCATVEGGSRYKSAVPVRDYEYLGVYDFNTYDYTEGEYDPLTPAMYVFSPVLALEENGYTTESGITMPRVLLTVLQYAGMLEIEANGDGDGTVTITGYPPPGAEGTLPDIVGDIASIEEKGLSITRIGVKAFEEFPGLNEFTVPETVISIGYPETSSEDSIFSGSLGGAFSGTGLTEITIPARVESIVSHAFYGVDLTNVAFAEGSQLNKIGEMVFSRCPSLTGITIPAGVTEIGLEAFSHSALGSVTFADGSALELIDERAFEAAPVTSIDLPEGLIKIADYAFSGSGLTSLTLPDSVEFIGNYAFFGSLAEINISPDSKLSYIGGGAFTYDLNKFNKNPIEGSVFLPESVSVIELGAFDTSGLEDDKTTISAYYDSYAAWWAEQNAHPLIVAPSRGEMLANPPGVLYKYIPYEFIAKTKVPDNKGLRFWLDRELPEGLKLYDGVTAPDPDAPDDILPGTIYGSPLDYTAFEDGADFTMYAQNIAGGFTASADFTITLAPTPDSTFLETYVNKYPFEPDPIHGGDGHIGVYNPITGQYEITGFYDTIGNQIMHIDGPFPLFDSLWIDGRKQTVDVQYNAETGSTRVTILAQTIQNLENGEHTAAAAFRREKTPTEENAYSVWNSGGSEDNEFDIAAQNFTVNLADRPAKPDDGNNDNDNDNSGDNNNDEDNNNNDDGNVNPTDPTGPTDSTESTNPTNPSNPTNPPGPSNPTDSTDSTESTNTAGSTNTSNSTNPINPTDPANPANPASQAASANNTAGAAAGETGNALAETTLAGAALAEAAAPDPNQAAAVNDARAGGLPTDENGRFYFVLDGSGAPMELRIDIPLAEYEEFYFDGEPWRQGEDYGAREGSTVLTVAAARLERYDAGLHTILARFLSETVEIVFELRKPAPAQGAGAAAVTEDAGPNAGAATEEQPAGPTRSENSDIPLPVLVAAVLLVICGAAAILRFRKKQG
ncbi:MAG: leucine-rich repeat protein [Clostridiales Family XIII bacterium]|nr:leucine-rich repeat protein [Clostridiales Family XIII bacterium]